MKRISPMEAHRTLEERVPPIPDEILKRGVRVSDNIEWFRNAIERKFKWGDIKGGTELTKTLIGICISEERWGDAAKSAKRIGDPRAQHFENLAKLARG